MTPDDIKDIGDIEALIHSDLPDSEIEAKLERFYVGIPESDVPFTFKIGQWIEPTDFEITVFECETQNPQLHLVNTKFMLRIRIMGRMKYRQEFRPKISKIHLTESIIQQKPSSSDEKIVRIGKVVLHPLIDTTHDQEYAGEWVNFEVHQELILGSMNMGRNVYVIKCGKRRKEIEVFQKK